VVVTGDITQTDLENPARSGFAHALRVLRNSGPKIGLVELEKADVVRNPVVQKIVDAYDRYEDHNPVVTQADLRRRDGRNGRKAEPEPEEAGRTIEALRPEAG
jgi:phosphate starvation-inducible PhoH-like protein